MKIIKLREKLLDYGWNCFVEKRNSKMIKHRWALRGYKWAQRKAEIEYLIAQNCNSL